MRPSMPRFLRTTNKIDQAGPVQGMCDSFDDTMREAAANSNLRPCGFQLLKNFSRSGDFVFNQWQILIQREFEILK